MSEHNITVQGGSSVRLPTAGKYCDRDIVVTALGGGDGGVIVCDLGVVTGATAIKALDGVKLKAPNVTNIANSDFAGFTGLLSADFPVVTNVGYSAFDGCTELSALILRTTEKVCAIAWYAFVDTPMLTGEGHIYVPSSMYESYRTAYEAEIDELAPGFFDILFRKIEDYPDITGT